jgi:hypothetical protein
MICYKLPKIISFGYQEALFIKIKIFDYFAASCEKDAETLA